MLKVFNNRINVGFPQNKEMNYPKPYLVMKENPRIKCALIIGDGFTQGYLRHYGIQGDVPCSMNDLMPANDTVPYLPTIGDVFPRSPFFTQDKWPKISKIVSDGLKGVDFFMKVSRGKINPGYDHGLWSLNNQTLDYEIRCYLWHYFRTIHYKFEGIKKGRPLLKDYGWYAIFKTILEKYFLQVISFNYDLVGWKAIEESMYLYSPGEVNDRLFVSARFPVEMPYDYYMNFYGPNDIPYVYIHGTWASQIQFPFPPSYFPMYSPDFKGNISVYNNIHEGTEDSLPFFAGFLANPWLENQIEFHDNYFSYVASRFDLRFNHFPMFPDIVPPGFQGDDKYNPYSQASESSRRILNDADVVIICGLSGREPDTAEVNNLLDNITKNIDVIHIGLDQDKTTPVATKLNSLPNVTWRFFNAQTQLSQVYEYLKDNDIKI